MGVALSKEEQYGLGGFQEYFAFPNANYEVQHKLVAHLLGQEAGLNHFGGSDHKICA